MSQGLFTWNGKAIRIWYQLVYAEYFTELPNASLTISGLPKLADILIFMTLTLRTLRFPDLALEVWLEVI